MPTPQEIISAIREMNPDQAKNMSDEAILTEYIATSGNQGTGVEEPPKSAVHAANRAVTSRVPIAGPILEHILPQTWGELAGDVASFAMPLAGAAAATNPLTAPLAPFLMGAGVGGKAMGAGRKALGALGRGAGVGTAAGVAEGIAGGDDPLGTAVRMGAGTALMEPLVGFGAKLGLSIFGRRGIEASDIRNISSVVEREVVNPYNKTPLFSFSTPAEIAMIAGGGGRQRLREMFETVENRIVNNAGGTQHQVWMPRELFPEIPPPVQGAPAQVQVTLAEALSRIKQFGAGGQFKGTPTAARFDERRAYREAQDQINLTLHNIDPELGLEYRAVREAYDKGLEFVELMEAPNVIRSGTGQLDWNALQAATFRRMGSLERHGLSTTPMTGITAGHQADIPGAVFRGGDVGERDIATAIPGLAWLFRGGQTAMGRPSVHVAPQFLQTMDFAGLPQPGLLPGSIPSGGFRSGAATASERLIPKRRENEDPPVGR